MATEEDKTKLAEAFASLKIKAPKIESPEDLEEFMKYYVTSTDDKKKLPTKSAELPEFSGEDGKKGVRYQTWRYQVQCHKEEKVFTDLQIVSGIRRSCTGTAADILRRMGTTATLGQILNKFESTYGMIDTGETIMKKLFACQQEPQESVMKFASRIEEFWTNAVELKMVSATNEEMLRSVLYQGLKPELRHNASYKYDTVKDYDKFKKELRKMEDDFKSRESATAHAATSAKSDGLEEVKDLLKQLHQRIDKLEKEKEESQGAYPQDWSRGQYRGGRSRGYRGNVGRGQYTPRRPVGRNTFRPYGHSYEEDASQEDNRTCYKCSKKGHIARRCPEN